jgi:hypothetical protein
MSKKKIPGTVPLNSLQAAQLRDSIVVGGCTAKINAAPKSMNKGYSDTPLFQVNNQTKLF